MSRAGTWGSLTSSEIEVPVYLDLDILTPKSGIQDCGQTHLFYMFAIWEQILVLLRGFPTQLSAQGCARDKIWASCLQSLCSSTLSISSTHHTIFL